MINVYDFADPSGATRHDDNRVGEQNGLGNAVSNEKYSIAIRAPDFLQLKCHPFAGYDVQRAERLIHQNDWRIHKKGPAYRHPLLHASGQLIRSEEQTSELQSLIRSSYA